MSKNNQAMKLAEGVCTSCAKGATQSTHAFLLRPQAVAYMLGVTTNTLANWRLKGRHKIPFIKVGNAVRYRLSDVEAFIEARLQVADASGLRCDV